MLKKPYHFFFEYPLSFLLTFTAQFLKNESPLKFKNSFTKEKEVPSFYTFSVKADVAVSMVQKKAIDFKSADLHCVLPLASDKTL